jgi:predicted RNA-binding Zn-ribbon protein involved in translation (DUF1610 family)
MPHPLHTGRLVLSPQDPEAAVDRRSLAAALARIGLTGDPLAGRADAFATGAHFARLIGFTGCAVQIETTPTDAAAFSHIVVEGPHATPHLLCGRNTRPPRCSSCTKPLADWRARVRASVIAHAPDLHCPECGETAAGWRWDWRQHGGFGRSFVRIEEVFPGEGAPLPELLAALCALGAGPWRYFYVQDD